MRMAVTVWLLAALSSVTGRAHEGALDSPATASSLFPLFITCDLKDEFLTPDVDSRTVMWLENAGFDTRRPGVPGGRTAERGKNRSRAAGAQCLARLATRERAHDAAWGEFHREPGGNECMEHRRSAWVWVVTKSIDANLAKTTHVLLLN